MVVVSEITLTIIGAGFNIQGMISVGGFVLIIATIPLVGIIAALHGIQVSLGQIGTFLTIMVGLIPAIFVFVIAPMLGVSGGDRGYVAILSVAGLPWSVAWYLTSPERFVSA